MLARAGFPRRRRIVPGDRLVLYASVWKRVFGVVEATGEQKDAAWQWFSSRVGQPYGIQALLEDGLMDIGHIPVYARIDPKRATCSGMVAAAYQQAGVRLTWHPLPSPADLSYSPLLLGSRPWRRKDQSAGAGAA